MNNLGSKPAPTNGRFALPLNPFRTTVFGTLLPIRSSQNVMAVRRSDVGASGSMPSQAPGLVSGSTRVGLFGEGVAEQADAHGCRIKPGMTGCKTVAIRVTHLVLIGRGAPISELSWLNTGPRRGEAGEMTSLNRPPRRRPRGRSPPASHRVAQARPASGHGRGRARSPGRWGRRCRPASARGRSAPCRPSRS